MIQLMIGEEKPVTCRSWTAAHKAILDGFDPAGNVSFNLQTADFEWQEEGMHLKTFDAVASTPEAMRLYVTIIGRM